jgi:hypothetical protein
MHKFKVGDRVVHKTRLLNGEVRSVYEMDGHTFLQVRTPDEETYSYWVGDWMLAESAPETKAEYLVLKSGGEEEWLSQHATQEAAQEWAVNNCHKHGVLTVVKALAHVKPVEDSEVIYV